MVKKKNFGMADEFDVSPTSRLMGMGRATLIALSLAVLLTGVGIGFGSGWLLHGASRSCENPGPRNPTTDTYSSKIMTTSSSVDQGSHSPNVSKIPTTTKPTIDSDCLDQIIDIIKGEDGWITWLRREDDSVSFNRTWDEYVRGFGDPNGNYWLGLKTLNQITGKNNRYKMRVELESYDGIKEWAEYQTFSIGDQHSRYQLNIGNFTGNTHDAFSSEFASGQLNGQPFTTWDNDNDGQRYGNCAISGGGHAGWWYNNCAQVYLTGQYKWFELWEPGYLSWYCAFGFCNYKPIKYVEAKVKLI